MGNGIGRSREGNYTGKTQPRKTLCSNFQGGAKFETSGQGEHSVTGSLEIASLTGGRGRRGLRGSIRKKKELRDLTNNSDPTQPEEYI